MSTYTIEGNPEIADTNLKSEERINFHPIMAEGLFGDVLKHIFFLESRNQNSFECAGHQNEKYATDLSLLTIWKSGLQVGHVVTWPSAQWWWVQHQLMVIWEIYKN